MITKKTKSGFTLAEMSIVLVIIGIIIVMAVKAYNMIISARLRGEIAKINTLAVGVSNYYTIYGFLPGDNLTAPSPSRLIITTKNNGYEIYEQLVKSEFVKNEDFAVLDLHNARVGTWKFVRCMHQVINQLDGTLSYKTTDSPYITPQFPLKGMLCITEDSNINLNVPATYPNFIDPVPGGDTAHWSIVAGYELFMDDGSIAGGDGRVGSKITDIPARKEIASKINNNGLFTLNNTNSYYYIRIWE